MSKNEANKIKSHNFTRSTRAKSNIAIYWLHFCIAHILLLLFWIMQYPSLSKWIVKSNKKNTLLLFSKSKRATTIWKQYRKEVKKKNNTKNDAKRNKNLEKQYKFFQLKFLQNTKIKDFFGQKVCSINNYFVIFTLVVVQCLLDTIYTHIYNIYIIYILNLYLHIYIHNFLGYTIYIYS